MAIEINICLLEDILAVTNVVKNNGNRSMYIFFYSSEEKGGSSRVCVEQNSKVFEMSDTCHFEMASLLCVYIQYV